MSYTITPGFDTDDYIITLADGRVIVVDGLTLNNLHSLDGTIDTEIDVDGLIANATTGNNSLAVFTSSSGTAFTVEQTGEDDYTIALADGRVIEIDGQTLNNLHSRDGTFNNEIDIDGLIANATAGNNSLAVFVCFAKGTWITTPSGQVPIEKLAAGDMVVTMDHGPQPIRWISSSKRHAIGDMAPILIRKGALGNTRDLRVSPQHRMLLSG